MATPKTQRTTASVDAFLDTVPDADRRRDARDIVSLFETLTKTKAQMWGEGIVGCGADIDVSTLKRLVTASVAHLHARYP